MRTLCVSIFAAVAALYAVAGVDYADVSVADFPRLEGETGDSARIMRAVEAAGKGGVVWFPRGEYDIDAMLVVSNSSSLLLHKSAHLKAVCEMPFVLKYFGRLMEAGNADSSGVVDHNLFIKGGDIDGAGLAGCAHVMGLRHFTIADSTFRNGKGVGLQFGDPNLPRAIEGGYEIVANNLYFICNKPGLAGNVGFLTYIGDSHFTDLIVVDYTIGIRDMKWSNRYTRCHVWGGIVKKAGTDEPEMLENSIAFDLCGDDSVLIDCYADTAMTGFWVRKDARIYNCAYFNNWRFKMDNPTVFRHDRGRLMVTGGRFSKNSPNSTLYASGKDAGELIWHDNYTLTFSAEEMAGLSAKLHKTVKSDAAVSPNLAGEGNASAVDAAVVGDSIPAAKMPKEKHVFSMSCKVTACNGGLATAGGRAKAIAWWKKNNITKLWLESYRHGERVASDRLVELRDAFRAEGFEVCGMITPTMLNDPAPGKKEPQMVVCWSDPKARERMREECARAAKVFDTVILDDFLFSSCGDGCARCRADKAARKIAAWGEYKRTLMYEVCERDILPAAKKANPKAHFIIKYPCWYRNYANNGYSPARQAELFGECWVGTETRDANPEPIQACWIAAWMDSVTHGRCGGGWYDALDCSPEKFIEQARYTILGGMKESLVHCYDYLLSDDPGRTPFGEKAASPRACAETFERESGNLAALAELVRGAERGKFEMLSCGVSRHEFRKDGKKFTIYLNTTGETVRGLATDISLAPHEMRIITP